jgi:hypothetical protein
MDTRTKEDVFNGVPPPPIEKASWWFKIATATCVLLALYGIIMFWLHYNFEPGYVPRQPTKPIIAHKPDYKFEINAEKWQKKYGDRKMPMPPETKVPKMDPTKTPDQMFEDWGP